MMTEEVCGSCKWRIRSDEDPEDYTCMNRESRECFDYVPWFGTCEKFDYLPWFGTCEKWEADEKDD